VAFVELSDEALTHLLRAEARELDGQLVVEPLDDGWVAAILRGQLSDRPIDSRVIQPTRREAMETLAMLLSH
jgi:hypothetical protein